MAGFLHYHWKMITVDSNALDQAILFAFTLEHILTHIVFISMATLLFLFPFLFQHPSQLEAPNNLYSNLHVPEMVMTDWQ